MSEQEPRQDGPIRLERSPEHEGALEIVLSRPERKNAINQQLARELLGALRAASDDDEVRVILLRGAGGCFCSGLDLDALRSGELDRGLQEGFSGLWREVHQTMWNLRKPVVGALERYAINAGAALALACDLLIGDDEGFLQVGEVRMGMAAPMNLFWLQAKWGLAKATQVALLGQRLGGRQLVELGIAAESMPAGQVIERARALQLELAALPPQGCQRILQGLRPGAGPA